eukprot:1488965-Amphidinium_carterae.1
MISNFEELLSLAATQGVGKLLLLPPSSLSADVPDDLAVLLGVGNLVDAKLMLLTLYEVVDDFDDLTPHRDFLVDAQPAQSLSLNVLM